MKRLMVLSVFWLFTLLLFVGCQGTSRNKNPMEVFIEGGGEFPPSLAGTWKADNYGWEFVFERDGSISSAVISLGLVRLMPGQIATVPMIMGGKGIYEPGQWIVHYVPTRRELTVEISLKNFYVKVGDNVLEGKNRDVFIGQISQDGKLWEVNWTSFPDYTAHTPEHPNFRMAEDPNYGITEAVTFQKVEK